MAGSGKNRCRGTSASDHLFAFTTPAPCTPPLPAETAPAAPPAASYPGTSPAPATAPARPATPPIRAAGGGGGDRSAAAFTPSELRSSRGPSDGSSPGWRRRGPKPPHLPPDQH